jgi:phage-related protein
VRSKNAALLAILAGDQLDLVALIEIATSSAALRYALDTEPRVWNGQTFAATSGFVGEIQESAEREVPALQLVLQNADGLLGPLVHPDTGGEDLRGKRVTVRQASRTLLSGANPNDLVIEWTFFVNCYSWIGRDAVAFEIGVFPAESVRVPDRTLQGLRCRWVYKGAHCGYVGDLATCDKTREDCRRHFEGEPLRFGGFPTAADARALRVE